jgi:AraC-like DNA-binding protein
MVFSFADILLSFSAMKVKVRLAPDCEGRITLYRNAGRRFPMHHHTELEFNLVDRGSGVYLLQDRKYILHRHSLVWLFPAQEHVLLDVSPDFEMWIGKFSPGLVRRTCTTPSTQALLEANPPDLFCRHITAEQAAQLGGFFTTVGSRHKETALFNAALAYGLLSAWNVYQSSNDLPSGTDIHPAVEKAARLLRDRIEPITVDEVARQAGLSADHLARLFKQQTGLSLVDFRNQQRIGRFLRLYGGGQRKTLLDAALEAGFGSYPQFHRVFRQQMGCSPAAHRHSLAQHAT